MMSQQTNYQKYKATIIRATGIWAKNNPEKMRENSNRYYQKNKEKCKQVRRDRYNNNPEYKARKLQKMRERYYKRKEEKMAEQKDCEMEGCTVKIPEEQVCIYCDDCLPIFEMMWEKWKKEDEEYLIGVEKESIEQGKERLRRIDGLIKKNTNS